MDRKNNPFLATIRLPVKNSPIMTIVVLSVHLIAMFLPWITGLGNSIKLILTITIMLSMCFYIHKYYFYQGNQRVTELILNSKDEWRVKMATGLVHQAILDKSLFVHPLLTIIQLHYADSRAHFIFTPETIEPDLFRRLRVRLRFKLENEI